MNTFVRLTLGPTVTKLKENDGDFRRVVSYIENIPPMKDSQDLERYKYVISNKFNWLIKALVSHYDEGNIDIKEEVIIYIKDSYLTMNSKSLKTIVEEASKETIALYFINYFSSIVNDSIWVPKGSVSLTTYFGTLTIK